MIGKLQQCVDTVCLLTGQKRLKNEYKDPDVLPKVNKADVIGTMEAINEYLRLCHAIVRTPLAYIITKTIIVQTLGNYPKYITPDNEMIARMTHPPLDEKKLHEG